MSKPLYASRSAIRIFTDGASKGNPGPGGWGAVIVSGDTVRELGGREEHTTNNRMELCAAIEALRFARSALHASRSAISVYADSTYLINGITKWVAGWKRNRWKTAAKKDVENRDLWERLDALVSGMTIEWRKVAGHADTPGNARADEIAGGFAQGTPPKLYVGPRGKYPIDLSAVGARESVRGKTAYSYVSLVDGRIETHQTWNECKRRVHGKKGARFKKAISPADERLIIERFKK